MSMIYYEYACQLYDIQWQCPDKCGKRTIYDIAYPPSNSNISIAIIKETQCNEIMKSDRVYLI